MKADLAKAESDLSIENSEYETKKTDYNSLIIACEEGIQLLTRMVHGES